MCWKIFHEKSTINPTDLFEFSPQGPYTRGHKFKIFVRRTNVDVRARFFTISIVDHWNKLSANTVNSPTLDQFKARVAGEMGEHFYAYAE